MKKYKIKTLSKNILADTITPVSVYLKLRELYPKSILLESSDYHGTENSYSYICLEPIATFELDNGMITESYPDDTIEKCKIKDEKTFNARFKNFINSFNSDANDEVLVNGFFGFTSYDAIKYFETLKIEADVKQQHKVPDLRYSFYKYIIAINHFKNDLHIIENLTENEESNVQLIETLLYSLNIKTYPFNLESEEESNITDDEYKYMVKKGKEHCFRGDVFQIVLSRQFSQKYSGDEFNVYRALRSINPSPYLFFFDYGDYQIFGSSPEAQLKIQSGKAIINPIAGTFKRTGDDEKDKKLAQKLAKDEKENAEHVMLVDLARNDLSRQAKNVTVDNYREIQFYSHVIHMVSTVSGVLENSENNIDVMTSTFPAGTLSGAPKFKAMELIDKYENQNRGYYGGAIGYIGLNGDINQAIMIRTFLSKDKTLFYQAGAGIVSESKEESELQEVNNKLGALKKAILMAKDIK